MSRREGFAFLGVFVGSWRVTDEIAWKAELRATSRMQTAAMTDESSATIRVGRKNYRKQLEHRIHLKTDSEAVTCIFQRRRWTSKQVDHLTYLEIS